MVEEFGFKIIRRELYYNKNLVHDVIEYTNQTDTHIFWQKSCMIK